MEKKYLEFFTRVSNIYNGADGYNCLLRAVNSEELKDGLNRREYDIAKTVLSEFFERRNTNGGNRIFGISGYIDTLSRKCEEKEKNP